MKHVMIGFLSILLIFSFSFGVDLKKKNSDSMHLKFDSFDNMDLDIEDGTVIMRYNHDNYRQVEITSDYELYVEGKHIKTSDKEKVLLKEFHDKMYDLIEEAQVIGMKGAKIGVKGAKVGLNALVGVIRLISPDYDSEDLERDMEEETEKLEKEAEVLEEQAEELEETAAELEELHEILIRTFPEIERARNR